MKKFWLTTLAPMSAIALATLAWAATLLPDAPERMATHFGLNGQPDGWSSPGVFFGLMVALEVFILLLFWWLSRGGGAHGMNARITTGIVAGSVTLLGFVTVWVFRANIAGDPALEFSELATMAGWSVLAGLVISWACRPAPAPHKRDIAPTHVDVPTGGTAAWLGYAPSSTVVLVLVLGLSVLLGIEAAAMTSWFILVVVALVLLLAAAFMHFEVTINSRGLRYKSLLGVPARTIELNRIQSVEPVELSPGEWGGWGFRGVGSNRALVTRGGEAIRIAYDSNQTLYITVDDAAGAAGTFNALTGR